MILENIEMQDVNGREEEKEDKKYEEVKKEDSSMTD